MAINMSPRLLRELNEMVVTCSEFKKTVLKILEVLFAPRTRKRNKKLSFFDGRSFDKMYQKIEDLIGKESGDTTIPEDVHKKLLKILKEYKGKKSPHKLLVVRKIIGFLEEPDPNSTKKRFGKTKYKSRTYKEFQGLVNEGLVPLRGKEEVYTNKKESKDEVKLWDEISGCVSKWDDGDPIDNEKYRQIGDCFESYKNKISEDKKTIFNNIVFQLNNVAFSYEEHHKRMKNYEKAVVDAKWLGEEYNKFITFALYEKEKGKNPENGGFYKRKNEKFDRNFGKVVKGLKEAYFDFSGENIRSLNNISNSFRIYSAHYKKGSENIDKLCDYLLVGIDVIFCSECFYKEFTGQSLNAKTLTGKSAEEIEDQLKKQLDKFKKTHIASYTGKYNVKEIKTFIENLKKGKF